MNPIATKVLDAAPELALGEAAVVVLTLSGDAFHNGKTYAKPLAHALASRAMTLDSSTSAYVAYRHRGGVTVYLSRDTVLATLADAEVL